MKGGVFLSNINEKENEELNKIAIKLLPNLNEEKFYIKCFHDNSEETERIYNVYCLETENKKYVLKKTNKYEVELYNNYLEKENFKVPKMYNHLEKENEFWILIDFIEGKDGKEFNNDIALKLSKGLTDILNKYWIEGGINKSLEKERFNRYWNRINKRKECLRDYPLLDKAYDVFLERQRTIPVSLGNGDMMQVNIIYTGEEVYIIDWAFGGFMPYALEVARVISHGAKEGFAYYMTDELRNIFISDVYNNLNKTNLTFEEFCYDVKLASLNEIIEFLEYDFNNPDEAKDRYYELDFKRANNIAKEILSEYRYKPIISFDEEYD